MKKKLLSTVLCVAMTAAMVAGCGSKTDDGNSAAATESGATASDGTIALTVWGAEEDQSLLQKMVDSFEAAADVYAFADDQLNELVQAGALQAGQEVQMGSFAGYKMLGVNAYSKNVGWAMELAKWITNEDNQTLRFEERGQGPANKNAAASDAVAASPAIKALMQVLSVTNSIVGLLEPLEDSDK